MSSYLDFVDRSIPGRKTKTLFILSKSTGAVLGEIKWFGRWRQYCFFPAADTIFNRDCMNSIKDVIDDLMDKRCFVTGGKGEELIDPTLCIDCGHLKHRTMCEVAVGDGPHKEPCGCRLLTKLAMSQAQGI